MLTKNAKQFQRMCLLACNSNANKGLLPINYTDGNTYYLSFPTSSAFPANSNVYFTTSTSSSGIILGSGTTAPTENDYRLESQFTSSMSASVQSTLMLDENDNPETIFTITVTNQKNTAVTVAEVGLVESLSASRSFNSSPSYFAFLLDRTVLDTPVTIPAGGYAVIEYTIKSVVS
jgi:hypothetical protein